MVGMLVMAVYLVYVPFLLFLVRFGALTIIEPSLPDH